MKTPLALPSQEYLREVFDYDPQLGLLRWRFRVDKSPQVNGRMAGAIIKHICSTSGYVRLRLDGKAYVAHRIIFKWMTGREPDEALDHRDGNRTNNRWANLREASLTENNRNTRGSRDGLKGAFPHAGADGWFSIIGVDKKQKYLGSFRTEQEAHDAYCAAAEEHHKEFANRGVAA